MEAYGKEKQLRGEIEIMGVAILTLVKTLRASKPEHVIEGFVPHPIYIKQDNEQTILGKDKGLRRLLFDL